MLRGMVEEGLKERQQLRERRSYSQASLVESVDQVSEEEDAPIVDEDIAEAKDSESNFRPGHEPPRVVTNTSSSHQADENGSTPRVRHHSPSPEPMNLRPNPPVMPFPQIRGTRLERLFFSAPEHYPSTCKLCRQRCRPPSPSAVEPQHDTVDTGNPEDDAEAGEEDEGFVEGSCESVDQQHEFREPAGSHSKGKQPRDLMKCLRGTNRDLKCSRPASRQVLTKIVRELEDDFTHYKR